MSAASSQASADSIMDSPELGFDTPSSVSQILGGEKSSPTTSPESRFTRTCETWGFNIKEIGRDGSSNPIQSLSPPMGSDKGGWGEMAMLISSAEAFLARTSPSPGDAQDSQELAQASSTSSPESLSLFDLDGFSSRTYPDCSPRTAVGTSESCLERWPTSGTAWAGGFSTAVSSECRSDDGECSSSEPSLTEILEEPQHVPAKYSLSARAAQGILRRAEKRGR